jgi:hypothetical protein
MDIKRNGSRPSGKGPEAYFTGTVRVDPMFQVGDPARLSGGHVTFEPGARSAWHTHPLGQTLIVPIQSTFLPLSDSVTAMCVIAVVAIAPCQCFSLGENQMISPGRISSIGPPSHCAQPRPDVEKVSDEQYRG